jgi:FkbM family methyltransferase
VRYGDGTIYLSHDDFAIDRETFKWVLVDRAYETDYTNAVVLDIGAHKGYFGAYALVRGARVVISYEPEPANVLLLERSAASYRERGRDWRVRDVAVGAEAGTSELHVMSASWGHSLHPPGEFDRWEVGLQEVEVASIASVLADAGELAGEGSPIVAKLNVEGEECAIVLETEPEIWTGVSELFVETHPWTDCAAPGLAARLARVGLAERPSSMAQVLRLRREAPPPGGRRSGPT